MLKKSLAISAVLHVIIATVIVYLILSHDKPVKPKPIPVTIVTLAPVQKTEKKPESLKKQPVVHKPIPKPKPVVQKPKPTPKPIVQKPLPLPKPEVKQEPVKPQPKQQKVQQDPVVTANIQNKYLSYIYQSIDKLKKYPKNAKRLGQTGVVKITFTVMADGTIADISVDKASGFLILDDAAKKILTTLTKVNPIPKELKKESLTITLPVSYSIE